MSGDIPPERQADELEASIGAMIQAIYSAQFHMAQKALPHDRRAWFLERRRLDLLEVARAAYSEASGRQMVQPDFIRFLVATPVTQSHQ